MSHAEQTSLRDLKGQEAERESWAARGAHGGQAPGVDADPEANGPQHPETQATTPREV